jgi:hypothetical protein
MNENGINQKIPTLQQGLLNQIINQIINQETQKPLKSLCKSSNKKNSL